MQAANGSLAPGTRLGPYEIQSLIGVGGMGEVYEARDTRLDRRVAVKVLAANLAPNPEALARFEREARTVSQLSHANICALYDVGREGETEYLVMEYLEGETLAVRLERGRLAIADALRIAIELTSALAAAHGEGLVHRDLKPGNVMLTKSGAKLLDFGLAKTLDSEERGTDGLTAMATATTPLTQVGSILGTLHYMSPEQLEGKSADSRSDIFSFGAVLQEMVTGRRVFDGPSQASVAAAILKEEPQPISAVVPAVPSELERLVQRCLAKQADERWQSTADRVHELRSINSDSSIRTSVTPQAQLRRSSKTERLAWGLALLLAIAVVWLGLRLGAPDQEASSSPIRFDIRPTGTERLRFAGESAAPVALSPDGRHLVYGLIENDGRNRLWLRSLDTVEPRPLPGTERGSRPFWSPDGRFIGFFSGGFLMKLELAGGVALPICEASNGRGGTWSADDTIVFSPNAESGLMRVPATGGQSEVLTALDKGVGEASHRYPHFLPDGKTVIFLVLRAEGASSVGAEAENRLDAVRIIDGERRNLIVGAANAEYEGGELLFFSGGSLRARAFDIDSLELTGPTRVVVPETQYDAPYERAIFSVSGRTLAFESGLNRGETELRWLDRKGQLVGRVGERRLQDAGVISPDGAHVANIRLLAGGSDLWIFDIGPERERKMTFNQNVIDSPRWSPDGQRLAYCILTGSVIEVFVGSVESGLSERLFDFPDSQWYTTDWSSDGRYLILLRDAKDIWAFDFEEPDRGPFPILDSPATEFFGELSPDGQWLAFASDESGRLEIYATSFPESRGKWQISDRGGLEPTWATDGRSVYYRTLGNRLNEVGISVSNGALRVGEVTSLFHVFFPDVDEDGWKYDVAPGGERFLVNALSEEEARIPLTVVVNWKTEP